jgi:hypothetical protein
MNQGLVLDGVSTLLVANNALQARVDLLEDLMESGKIELSGKGLLLHDRNEDLLCEYKVVGHSRYEEDVDGYREMLIIRVRQEDSVWLDSFYSDLCDALKDKYSNEVCGCEHDCCGCVQQSVTNILDLGHLCYAINVTGVRNI